VILSLLNLVSHWLFCRRYPPPQKKKYLFVQFIFTVTSIFSIVLIIDGHFYFQAHVSFATNFPVPPVEKVFYIIDGRLFPSIHIVTAFLG